MRIAITGSSGRVGRAIHVRLARHHEVVGFDRVPSSTADIVADLEDDEALDMLLRGSDAVVHVAALHAPHVGLVPDAEFERINVRATAKLLQACAERGIARFVFTSTTALYGAAVGAMEAAWLDEATPPQPRTVYHRTKLAAEALVAQAAASGRLSAVVLRMSRCFPEPADRMSVYRLHRGIDARDVASAHQWAVESGVPGGRLFVVSGATPFRREDGAALSRDAAGLLRERAPRLADAFEQRGWPLPASIDRVCVPNALIDAGWTPRFGFDEVLRQVDAESSEVLPVRARTG